MIEQTVYIILYTNCVLAFFLNVKRQAENRYIAMIVLSAAVPSSALPAPSYDTRFLDRMISFADTFDWEKRRTKVAQPGNVTATRKRYSMQVRFVRCCRLMVSSDDERDRPKEWRAIATRNDRAEASFLGGLHLAAALDWLSDGPWRFSGRRT
ncbi:hypothetical protein [Aureimonas psammosilenae]|uniref:hypothetical protein n=1 Tax=Aureimonas psammosilenae TaxID=2495496 RepID=UPI001260B42B|nr:hypothetical protein [Aureimonas psammosilenae]